MQNKSTVPHSAIGTDHAIEHENCAMKVLGGIKGITNNRIALQRHFLIMPEMGTTTDEFSETFNTADGGKAFLFVALSLRYN